MAAQRQARAWVGYAVAKALGLDLTKQADKAKVLGLLKVWLGAGGLVVVKRLDPDRRRPRTTSKSPRRIDFAQPGNPTFFCTAPPPTPL